VRGVWLEIASGLYDVGLALGVEKLCTPSTEKSISILSGASSRLLQLLGFQFTAPYAFFLRNYMRKYGVSAEDFAKVVVKNTFNGSLNPYAQRRTPLTAEQVINSRMVCDPLTLYMCSSIGDGAAAAILCAKEAARKYAGGALVHIAGCSLRSGLPKWPRDSDVPPIATLSANEAYEQAGIGPEDVAVAEVHDGMAPAELLCCEELGFCAQGESRFMLEHRRTWIDGDKPVNPSGGLAARGHPVSATGIAQVAEIVWQLRGEAGKRQVANRPKIGLVENAGGWIGEDNAACTVAILKK
ncbi:MAG: thiolase family protein, partial [Betaproteobacteria bacterium]|nr:thiolase family protein [Betaproteobacteria bacterium]